MLPPLELFFEDQACRVHRARALLCLEWHATPTEASVSASSRTLLGVLRASAHPFVLCAVALPGIGVPDGPAREAMRSTSQRIDPHLACTVTIIRATGFQSAAIRSALSGLVQLFRPKSPVAFVATDDEAATHLAKHWPAADAPTPLPGDIAASLAALRAR